MSDDTFERFTTILHQAGAWRYVHYLPQRRSLWYSTDEALPVDPANARTNLYFSVHPSTAIPPANAHGEVTDAEHVRAQLAFVAAINCLFAEFDAKHYDGKARTYAHIQALTPAPSVVVDSGAGYHCYWLLEATYILDSDHRRQAARYIQDAWVGVVGGDPGVKDLTRILRVPGSHNFKYDPAPVVSWVSVDLDRRYALQTLAALLPPVVVPTVEKIRFAPTHGDAVADFNTRTDIAALLERYGYTRRGRRRMVSPWSGSHRDGVSIDDDSNRAFVHTGGDPLCDGYWKRPFDVIRILDYDGDFQRTLKAVREGRQ